MAYDSTLALKLTYTIPHFLNFDSLFGSNCYKTNSMTNTDGLNIKYFFTCSYIFFSTLFIFFISPVSHLSKIFPNFEFS